VRPGRRSGDAAGRIGLSFPWVRLKRFSEGHFHTPTSSGPWSLPCRSARAFIITKKTGTRISVERIDVLAHCRHRIVRAHLCYSVLRCRLRKSFSLSGYLSNRCIRQDWTETTAERDTVERGTRRCRPVDFAGSCPSRLFRGHCIWSSVFEKAALANARTFEPPP
jgi:hypothetical protein